MTWRPCRSSSPHRPDILRTSHYAFDFTVFQIHNDDTKCFCESYPVKVPMPMSFGIAHSVNASYYLFPINPKDPFLGLGIIFLSLILCCFALNPLATCFLFVIFFLDNLRPKGPVQRFLMCFKSPRRNRQRCHPVHYRTSFQLIMPPLPDRNPPELLAQNLMILICFVWVRVGRYLLVSN